MIYFRVRKIHLKLFHHFVFVHDLAVLGLFHQVFSMAKMTEIKKKNIVGDCRKLQSVSIFSEKYRKFGSPIVMH